MGLRWVVFRYLREFHEWDYTRIGRATGWDHTTVIHAMKNWESLEWGNRAAYLELIQREVIPEDLVTVGATL